jgi:serine/threonine-protein kinase
VTPTTGETVSHYRILEHLGGGGMGTVYKALDLRLNRAVALKFLSHEYIRDPGAKERFFQEARASSALQHKNICVIYDIEESEEAQVFISMEFLEGQTLKKQIESGPLSIDEAVKIASQVAQGLSRAHECGIIHQDIKPANVIVTKDRTAKILDFGVARQRHGETLLPDGHVPGTVAYMSPEQLRGDDVDHRTDIWSLGVMLYEMVTGKHPFGSDYQQATLYSVLHQKHRPATSLRPEIPVALEKIVSRSLEKDPAARYPDVKSVIEALKKVGLERAHPSRESTKSIAVLPFADLSPEKENQYFSDGLTEEIITKLSRLRNVRTISRTSVMNYERAGKSMKQIADELGVLYLLEGSVRKHGSTLRITTQLIDTDRDTYLWAETYDGSTEEIFDIQEKVATRIAKALRLRLSPAEKRTLTRRATENAEALQLYMKGRFFWSKRNEEALRKAVDYFEQAISKDQEYAPAWAGIADAYNFMTEYANIPRSETYAWARAAVDRALECDPELAEAHASLGSLLMLKEWDWAGAEKEFKRAIELDPNYATAHHWYAEWLSVQGRVKESISEISLAVSLEPLSPAILKDKGMLLYYARDFDGAIDSARKALELDPTFTLAHRVLSMAYQGKGMFDDAIEENHRWGSERARQVDAAIALAQCFAAAGRTEKVEALMLQILAANPTGGNLCRGIALVYASTGEIDKAFAWLEKAFEARAEAITTIKVDPKVDPLRADPRFDSLVRRIGLEH